MYRHGATPALCQIGFAGSSGTGPGTSGGSGGSGVMGWSGPDGGLGYSISLNVVPSCNAKSEARCVAD